MSLYNCFTKLRFLSSNFLRPSFFTSLRCVQLSDATRIENSAVPQDEDQDPDAVQIKSGRQLKNRNLAWYEAKLTKLAESRNLARAIHLVEIEMIKESRIEPSYFILHKLISICAQAGYVEKAMHLFHQMKVSGFQPKSKTYTLMFNACCESPNKTLGLEKAHRLKQMFTSDLDKGHLNDMSIASYKAMIRAFGRCGDIHTAFAIMDEAVAKFKQPDRDCFAALLNACIEQKEGGFYYAMKVWTQLVEMGLKPDVRLINLVLRSARDCSAFVKTTPQKIAPPQKLKPKEISSSSSTGSELMEQATTSAETRLVAFGGVQGVLEKCRSLGEKPDLKTLSLLVQMCPSGQDELAIFEEAKNLEMKLDINFFNVLIAKMNRQQRFEDARNVVVTVMPEHSLIPDLHTFGSLAMGCFDLNSGKALLCQLEDRRLVPSIELVNILLFNSKLNFGYKEFLLKEMSHLGVKPNKNSIMIVEKALGLARKFLFNKETDMKKRRALTKRFDSFSKFYFDWLRKIPVDLDDEKDPFSKIISSQKIEEEKESDRSIDFVDQSKKN